MWNKIKRVALLALVAVVMVACGGSVVEIKGEFISAADSMVYIECFSSSPQGVIIDSAILNPKGEFTLRFKSEEEELSMYNLVYEHYRIPLLLQGGDRVKINAIGNVVSSYRVDGSLESEQLRNFYQPYVRDIGELNKIATRYADPRLSEQARGDLANDYTKLYNAIRRHQIEYIIENRSNLAAVYAISQRLSGDVYIFNSQSDAVYYRTLLESLKESYPTSKYIKVLENRIAELDLINRLSNDLTTVSLPEIELADMYGQKHKLSESLGEVTLLEFWSAELGNSNVFNAELKEIYEKYSERGFVIYQVAVDPMKSRWIAAVQEQKLPWISVNDPSGASSQYLKLYNVSTLPANFIISRDGDILAKNLFMSELEGSIDRAFEYIVPANQ